MWEYFPTLQDVWKVTDNNTLDYRTLEIFGEGIWQKDERLELRYSVSPEFEAIDKIYEANILEGIVNDAEGNINEILKYLKEKPVALVAADIAALSVYAEWLNEAKHEGYIVNIVRNSYIRAGSNVNIFDPHKPMDRFLTTVYYPVENKKEYSGWKRIVMKFEELKCDPKETMKRFCEETGLEWSDKFLDVQATYKNISGFDLASVYRTWEEYYSGYDRFRICLVKGPWQRKYGYPYVNSLEFSRRELQEMFLKKFRFEQNLVFESQELENVYMKWRQRWMNQILWDVRRKEILAQK